MNYLLSIALKNLMRHRRRTVLTFLILTFGISIYILMAGMLKGFDEQSFKNQIEFETGDFKIRSAQYDEEHPSEISNFIANPEAVLAVLRSRPYVKALTERTIVRADVDNGRVSSMVQIVGVNPDTENAVFTFSNYISEGEFVPHSVVMGKGLSQDLGVGVGDLVYLTFRDKSGIFDSVEVNISGLMLSPNPQINQSTVFIDQDTLRGFLRTGGVTEIAVKTADYKKYAEYEPDLVSNLPGYRIKNWKALGEEFLAVGAMKSKSIGLILFFVAVIAVVGIVNTLLMSVFEKKREIGTLKALGMTDRQIKHLFVLEGLLIGLMGAVTGLIVGTIANLYFVLVGLDLTAMMGPNVDIGYKVLGTVKSAWDVKSMFGAAFFSVVVSVLASYYPAGKAVKLEAAECLRTIQ